MSLTTHSWSNRQDSPKQGNDALSVDFCVFGFSPKQKPPQACAHRSAAEDRNNSDKAAKNKPEGRQAGKVKQGNHRAAKQGEPMKTSRRTRRRTQKPRAQNKKSTGTLRAERTKASNLDHYVLIVRTINVSVIGLFPTKSHLASASTDQTA